MGLPQLPWGTLIGVMTDTYEKAISHSDYSNINYNVKIGGDPVYNKGWIIENDTVISEEREIDYVNDDLADIYEYIYQNMDHPHRADSALYLDYKSSDITEKGILTKLKSEFVFLKPGEVYTETYNLIGFKMVGGNFDFRIQEDSLYGFVYTPIWDEKRKKWIETKTDLPKKVGSYTLYKGKFCSNSVGVTFKGE
jgi:hypothetical protein